MDGDAMTVKQAAAHLGISPKAVLQLLKRGRLTGEQLDGWLWLVSRASVLAYESEHAGRRKPGPEPGSKSVAA
mgnify:CR=1 FL=1